MAKRENETTETSTGAQTNKTGLYVIGAVAVAALAAGLYFLNAGEAGVTPGTDGAATSASTPAQPLPAKASPELAALMESGPLEDIVLGDPSADIVIVEYASMTCPHCAHFYTEVFPKVKEKYIDTGKARFIFREFPLDSLAARASMLARCVGKDRFYPIVDGLFETQETWAAPGPDGQEKLKLIAKQAGFSEESYKKCIEDKDLFNKIVAVRKKAHEEFGVDGTPAFFVNGERLEGITIESFDAAIEGKPETPSNG